MTKRWHRAARILLLAVIFVVVFYPLYQTVILSLQPTDDIAAYINQIENRTLRFIPGYFWPRSFSFEQFTLAANDAFWRAYLVAVIYTASITLLHFPIALVLGLVFAKMRFKGRDALFFAFLAAMVLPFHVTLVPLHQILNRIHLFDTPWAVILPGLFSPLGVFLVRQFFRQIPDDVLEAAAIDGAGLFRTLVSIMIPIARYGLSIFFLLTVTMQWSSIEPSLAFIRSSEWQPISLMLRTLMENAPAHMFAPAVVYVLPMLLLFGIIFKNSADKFLDI